MSLEAKLRIALVVALAALCLYAWFERKYLRPRRNALQVGAERWLRRGFSDLRRIGELPEDLQ